MQGEPETPLSRQGRLRICEAVRREDLDPDKTFHAEDTVSYSSRQFATKPNQPLRRLLTHTVADVPLPIAQGQDPGVRSHQEFGIIGATPQIVCPFHRTRGRGGAAMVVIN